MLFDRGDISQRISLLDENDQWVERTTLKRDRKKLWRQPRPIDRLVCAENWILKNTENNSIRFCAMFKNLKEKIATQGNKIIQTSFTGVATSDSVRMQKFSIRSFKVVFCFQPSSLNESQSRNRTSSVASRDENSVCVEFFFLSRRISLIFFNLRWTTDLGWIRRPVTSVSSALPPVRIVFLTFLHREISFRHRTSNRNSALTKVTSNLEP